MCASNHKKASRGTPQDPHAEQLRILIGDRVGHLYRPSDRVFQVDEDAAPAAWRRPLVDAVVHLCESSAGRGVDDGAQGEVHLGESLFGLLTAAFEEETDPRRDGFPLGARRWLEGAVRREPVGVGGDGLRQVDGRKTVSVLAGGGALPLVVASAHGNRAQTGQSGEE
ncbi:hypothetical protein [Streptomyces sp. NBC_01428]|uniref:hypothetical protein n=1 Tax=Streptomyces sp. NBC_01428 TaxID=2903861 RepID=UPI002E3388BC|nr:hypothetical protein [Streptomyces sp. NBC_01428]